MSTAETQQTQIPAGTWTVDPVHSAVEFNVFDSELMSNIRGRFTDFEGTIELNGEPQSWRAQGVIRTASVSTDNEKRDAHLRSADFFDADRFPEIRFESNRVEQQGDKLHIVGRLTIKEQTHEVELDASILGTGVGQMAGDERIVLEAGGGFEWASTSVKITTNISATKA